MRAFFDTKSYVESPLTDGKCGGCGSSSRECKPPAAARKRFKEMTGLVWPLGLLFMNLPLRKDFGSLGLDGSEVPESISLCAACSTAYMEEFNASHARVCAAK